MSTRLSWILLVLLSSGCASAPPSVDSAIRREIHSSRLVYVTLEYWPGLREFAEAALRKALSRCSSELTLTSSQAEGELHVQYFHLQAICVDCVDRPAPGSFEVRILKREHEMVRWQRPNIGCTHADCLANMAMRATGKLLCDATTPN